MAKKLSNKKNKKSSSSHKKTENKDVEKKKKIIKIIEQDENVVNDEIIENTKKENKNPLILHIKKYKLYYIPGFIFLLTLFAYFNAFDNDFVNWDDDRYVTLNPYITEFSWENIKYFFTNYYFVMYIPLTMISYMFDYQMVGLESPSFYHAHNIIIHLINTVLVFILIYQIIKRINKKQAIFYAAISSLFFGVHPLHIESVTWIAERKDVLFTMFYLASLIMYMLYIKKIQTKYYFLALFLFLLSCFSKTQAVVLSVSMILIDYLIGRIDLSKENIKTFFREKRYFKDKVVLEKIPFFVISAFFGLLAIFAIGTEEPLAENFSSVKISTNEPYPFYENFLYSCYSFTHYIIKLIVPQNLSAIHPYPMKTDNIIPLKFWFYPVPILLLGIYTIWAFIKNKKYQVFSILFFTVNIILVLQLASVQNFLLSEHYAYIPAIGLSLLLVYYHFKIIEKNINFKPVLNVFWGLYISFLTIFTFYYNDVWQNSLTLWDKVIEQYPQVIVAHYNRGNYNQELGDKAEAEGNSDVAMEYYLEAIKNYDETIELHQYNIGAWSNRGITKAKIGNPQGAISDFNQVIKIDSTYGNVFSNKGNAMIMLNMYDSAIYNYTKAIELRPDFEDAYFNRAIAYNYLKKDSLAISDYTYLVENSTKYPEIEIYRGYSYYFSGDYENALTDINNYLKKYNENYKAQYYKYMIYKKIGEEELASEQLKILSNFPQVIDVILEEGEKFEAQGDYYGNIGFYKEADEKYQIVLKINPNHVTTLVKIGILNGKMNDISLAIEYFDKAIVIDSTSTDALTNRGYAYDLIGNKTKAIEDYTKAISFNTNAKTAYYNRGAIYNQLNKYNAAIEDFTKCLAIDNTYYLAYFSRGVSYQKTNNLQSACADWENALQLGYSNAQNYILKYCK